MINDLLAHIDNDETGEALAGRLWYHGCTAGDGRVWPFSSGEKFQAIADQAGLLRRSVCGGATYVVYRIKDTNDFSESSFASIPKIGTAKMSYNGTEMQTPLSKKDNNHRWKIEQDT